MGVVHGRGASCVLTGLQNRGLGGSSPSTPASHEFRSCAFKELWLFLAHYFRRWATLRSVFAPVDQLHRALGETLLIGRADITLQHARRGDAADRLHLLFTAAGVRQGRQHALAESMGGEASRKSRRLGCVRKPSVSRLGGPRAPVRRGEIGEMRRRRGVERPAQIDADGKAVQQPSGLAGAHADLVVADMLRPKPQSVANAKAGRPHDLKRRPLRRAERPSLAEHRRVVGPPRFGAARPIAFLFDAHRRVFVHQSGDDAIAEQDLQHLEEGVRGARLPRLAIHQGDDVPALELLKRDVAKLDAKRVDLVAIGRLRNRRAQQKLVRAEIARTQIAERAGRKAAFAWSLDDGLVFQRRIIGGFVLARLPGIAGQPDLRLTDAAKIPDHLAVARRFALQKLVRLSSRHA